MDTTAKGVLLILGIGVITAVGVGTGMVIANSTFETSGVVVTSGRCDPDDSRVVLQVFASDNELLGAGPLTHPYYRASRDECEWIFRIPDIEKSRGPYRLDVKGIKFVFDESRAKTLRLRMEGHRVEQTKELR